MPDDARWRRLRSDLARITAERPGALGMHPTLDPVDRRPPDEPVEIHLSPDALPQAAALHEKYGDYLSLHVGALPYPPGSGPLPRWLRRKPDDREQLDPDELVVELESPLSVSSGQTVTHAVRVTNRSDHEVAVHTNGFVTAEVIDAAGVIVGGFVGAQAMPLHIFRASPSGSVRIRLCIGTASLSSDLGYAIPPGTWHLTVPLDLADGRRLVSPPLEFTVTA